MTPDAEGMIDCLREFGYSVWRRPVEGRVEVLAIPVGDGVIHFGVCRDGDGEEEEFRALEILARAIVGDDAE